MQAANVTTGKRRTAGGIYRAPVGTTLPTDASTSLAASFKNVGYISEDGYTNTLTKNVNDIKEWGGETVDSEIQDQKEEFKFKMISSLNTDARKAVYGDANVSESSGAITTIVKAGVFGDGVWVIDEAVKGGRLMRTVIPNGKITSIGDIPHKGTEAIGFDVTLTAMYDSTVGGTSKHYISAPPTT